MKRESLGTFLGVYTPSLLTILGVILYLRMGWVVGNAGLFRTLVIVAIANAITLVTSLSISAIATNMFVGPGGAYFIISRSLGLQIGGAIGFPLFLAQAFSVTLYAFGFAESLTFVWPNVPVQYVAAATVLIVSFLAGRGAETAMKIQIPVLILVGLSLLSLYLGIHPGADLAGGSAMQPFSKAPGFWVIFAVFFPAVTGIMAGVSLSGDLKNPTRSIPLGTITAVLTGFVIYITVPIALALAAPRSVLINDPLAWMRVSAIPLLILPGLWGAILSSAMGSILGAPRTLEALVDDGVLPRFLKSDRAVTGFTREHFLSAGVALAGVFMGNLNAVAPVLTMFFLTTYGMMNLVAGLERLSGAPSFRPRVRVPWVISIAGAAACFWVMFLINHLAGIAALIAELVIYLFLREKALHSSWGDLRFGALMSLARSTLLYLQRLPVAPRNWRPHILLFAGDVQRRITLVRFAAWLNQGRGILTVSRVIVGDLADLAPSIPEEMGTLRRDLDGAGMSAFPEVEVVSSFEEGVIAVIQANGIAGISSNTVMFGWSRKIERLVSQLRIMRTITHLAKSTVILREQSRDLRVRPRRIDVWWGGMQNNGDMLLLFAYLLSVNPEFKRAAIVVHSIASSPMMLEQTREALKEMLQASRIKADLDITLIEPGVTIRETIHERSSDADIVFLGLKVPGEGEEAAYAEHLIALVDGLPTTVLVHNGSIFSGRLLEEH